MGLMFQTQNKQASTPSQTAAAARTSLLPRNSLARSDSFDSSQLSAGPNSSGLGHDFSQVSVNSASHDSNVHGTNRDLDAAQNFLGVSSSGGPTVTITYTPEATDKSTKIVFLQVVQVSFDGTPLKAGSVHANFSHMDADTTADFYCVDHSPGEADPYYNGDDAGKDGGTQGNATSSPKVDADMTDTPDLGDASYPVGAKDYKAEFRTIAFSAAGADKGTFYAYAHWSFNREKGKTGTIKHEGTSTNTGLPKSKAAINLWCTNHGFALPK